MFQLRVALALVAAAAAPGIRAQQLPRPAGDWAVEINGGKPIALHAYRGKVVALAFILTTCPHCQKTVAIMSRLQAEYAARRFQAIASAVEDGSKAAVPGFIRTFHPGFPVGYNSDPQKLVDFWQIPRARYPLMPIVLIVDRGGVVRFEHEGHDAEFFGDRQEQNFRREIEELLKK